MKLLCLLLLCSTLSASEARWRGVIGVQPDERLLEATLYACQQWSSVSGVEFGYGPEVRIVLDRKGKCFPSRFHYAVTCWSAVEGEIKSALIVVNGRAYAWRSYLGATLLHEFGHVLGLLDESPLSMTLSSEQIAAVQEIYGE